MNVSDILAKKSRGRIAEMKSDIYLIVPKAIPLISALMALVVTNFEHRV